jgi:hypothetical protein
VIPILLSSAQKNIREKNLKQSEEKGGGKERWDFQLRSLMLCITIMKYLTHATYEERFILAVSVGG